MTTPAGAASMLAVPTWRARIAAALWDYAAIVAWLALLTVVGALVRLLTPLDGPTGPVTSGQVRLTDVLAFAATVLPVGVYFMVTEAGPRQASWGKLRVGLRVVRTAGSCAGIGRIIVRTAVKLLPWQLAHISVVRMMVDVRDAAALTWTTYFASLALVVVTVIVAWRDPFRRALHDLIAGTRVVTTPDGLAHQHVGGAARRPIGGW